MGCDPESEVFDAQNGQTLTTFSQSNATLPVPEDGASFELTVESSTRSNVDRTISVNVDESSTADPSEYNIENESLVIPAGEYIGTIVINGNFDAIPDLTTTSLIINLDSVEGSNLVGEYRSTFTLNMFKQCPSELQGTYIASSTGSSTDGGTGEPTVTNFMYEVTIEKTGDLDYNISDGFAGVYIEWYGAAYGYTFETEGNFQDVCGSLSGSWTDGFQSEVTLEGTVNDDGTLTITWVNGFGDTATAIYTPQ